MVKWANSSCISLLQRQGSRVRIHVSPSFFIARMRPEEKSREKSSRIVNERERVDVDIRSTGCDRVTAREACKSGMAMRKAFSSFQKKRTTKYIYI